MADTKFMNFAEVTPNLGDSVLVANSDNGVRRALLRTLKDVLGVNASETGGIIAGSFTTNGYAKFAGGLIVAWGHVSDKSGAQEKNVNYPISFTEWPGLAVSAAYGLATVKAPRNDGFTCSYRRDYIDSIATSAMTDNADIMYIAVGH